MRCRAAVGLALVAGLYARTADAALDATVSIQNAPVRLDSCVAGRTGPGTAFDAAHFSAGYAFTNTSRMRAVSVRFKFTVSDARGNFAFIAYATENGRFAPGTTIDRTKRSRAQTQRSQPQGTVSCAIDRVAFAGGGTWPPGIAVRSSSAPSPAPAPARKTTPRATAGPAVRASDDHLWLLAGTQANPIAHGHPAYCTAGEAVQPWNGPGCRYARFLWVAQHSRAAATPPPAPTPTPSPSPAAASSQPPSSPKASRHGRAPRPPRATATPARVQPKTACDRSTIDGLNAKVSADARALRTSESEHAELIDRQAFATALHCNAPDAGEQRLIDLGAANNDFEIGATDGRLGQFEDAATSLGFAADEAGALLANAAAPSEIRDAAKPLLARVRQWQGFVARRTVPQP